MQKLDYNQLKKKYEEALGDARKTVGLFSEYGVEDARRLFWKSWEEGKNFAKRISYYDVIFLAIDSRNESFWGYLARLVIRILINFTIGFTTALISFLWNLIWFVRSYSSGILGILFWLLAASAAFSIYATTLAAMFGTVVGSGTALLHYSRQESIRSGSTGQRYNRVNYHHD